MQPIAELDDRFSAPGAAVTPWSDTEKLIATAELFWISTVRGDGRPHVTPLPAVWDDGVLFFATGPLEQKGVNLAANPHSALMTGNNAWKEGIDVVVEGVAERVTDDSRLRELAALWLEKYHGDWHYEVADGEFLQDGHNAHVFAVAPRKVLAFAKGEFAQTRYRFP